MLALRIVRPGVFAIPAVVVAYYDTSGIGEVW
jgi:hypothetical protein